jgi:hypothetical protein
MSAAQIASGRHDYIRNTSTPAEQGLVHINFLYDIVDAEMRGGNALFGGPVSPAALSIKQGEALWAVKMPAIPTHSATDGGSTAGFSCFNGAGDKAYTPNLWEYYDSIRFVGIAKADPKASEIDENDSAESFAAQIGGTTGIPLTGPFSIQAGQWIMAIPPNPKEAPIQLIERESHHNGNMPPERYIGRIVPFEFALDDFTYDMLRSAILGIVKPNAPKLKTRNGGITAAAQMFIRFVKTFYRMVANVISAENLRAGAASALDDDEQLYAFIVKILGEDNDQDAEDAEDRRWLLFDLFSSWTAAHYFQRKHIIGQAISDGVSGGDLDVFIGGHTA